MPSFGRVGLKSEGRPAGKSGKTPVIGIACLLEGEDAMPRVELHPQLDQFYSIAANDVKSSGYASRNRICYNIGTDRPLLAGSLKRGGKIGPEYYQENALAVDMFERAIIDRSKAKDENKTVALWYLSKFHQGAAPLLTRDVVAVARLLNANEDTLAFYIFLQSLADVISTDPVFIYLIKHGDPGKWEKFKQVSFKDWATKEGYSANEWQCSFSGSKLFGNLAQLGTFIVPPVKIVLKFIDICSGTDKLEAAKQVCDIAEQLNAPLAYQMAQVIYDDTWKCVTELGVAVTMQVLSAPLKVVAGPKGYVVFRIPGVKVLHTPTSSIAKALGSVPSIVVSTAPPLLLQFTLDKTLIEKVVKDVNEIILPIFTVRRDRQGTFKAAPNSGRDRVYNLYERMTVIALISYLGTPLPADFELDAPKDQGEDQIKNWYRLQARAAFKSLLGSYADENCLRDIAYGMAEDEYIAEALGAKDTNSAKLWRVDRAYRDNSSKRPISFLRFLCVCSGLAENHSVTHEDKIKGKDRVWDGLGPGLPGKRFVSQMKGRTMEPMFGKADLPGDWKRRQQQIWRDEQEEDFASLSSAEIRDPRMLVKRYRCMPAMGPEYISSHIKEIQSKIKIQFSYLAPPHYDEVKADMVYKQRWLMDKEQVSCGCCGTALSMTNRHHCRYCGGLFCSTHCKNNALDLVNVETGKKEGVRVCDRCKDFYLKLDVKNIDLDNVALREGDVIARPSVRKGFFTV